MKESRFNFILLILGLIVSAMGVSIYILSGLGVSTVSSIPYITARIVEFLTVGMTTILFQVILIVLLIILYGYQHKYLVSLLLGVVFGLLVDFWGFFWLRTPLIQFPSLVLMVLALLILPLGISLSIESRITALPFDLIVSDIAKNSYRSVRKVKVTFDVVCVLVTVLLSFIYFQWIYGIGLATVVSVFVNGPLIHFYSEKIREIKISILKEKQNGKLIKSK